VFGEKHTAQLGEASGRIIEHSQDRLAIGDRESDKILLGVERDKERIACVLEAGREQEPSQKGLPSSAASCCRSTSGGCAKGSSSGLKSQVVWGADH
jgi:hypothetical protein